VHRPKAQWKEAEEPVVLGERGAIRRFDDDSRPGYMMIFICNNIVTIIIGHGRDVELEYVKRPGKRVDDLILEPPKPEELAQEGNETQEVIATEETQATKEVTVAPTLAESKTLYFDGNVSLDKYSKDCSGGECALLSWIKEDPFAHITVDGYGNTSGDLIEKRPLGNMIQLQVQSIRVIVILIPL